MLAKRPTSKQSAGLLLFPQRNGLLLGHPGDAFCRKKDQGAWPILKGLIAPGEPPNVAAHREFHRPTGNTIYLGTAKQPGGKLVHIWAMRRSSKQYVRIGMATSLRAATDIPEIDRAAWFGLAEARIRMLKGQVTFIDRLLEAVGKAAHSKSIRPLTDLFRNNQFPNLGRAMSALGRSVDERSNTST